MKRIAVVFLVMAMAIGAIGCTEEEVAGVKQPIVNEQISVIDSETPSTPDCEADQLVAAVELVPEPPKVETVNLVSVGDIMAHTAQFDAAYNSETDDYDFAEQFSAIKPYIEEADLAVGNFETVCAGKDQKYSGTNMIFNVPDILLENLKDSGFDILTTANNHSLDRKFFGIERTIDVMDDLGIEHTGTFKTAEDERVLVVESKGITFGIIAYTFSTNGWPIPKGKEFSINMLDRELIFADIERAKELDVDFIISSVHWGNEYKLKPSVHQTKLGREMVDAGVDIVLGHHPHVVEPMEWYNDGLIIYSMGNFVSGQRTHPRDYGMLVNLTFKKEEEQEPKFYAASMMPTYVQYDFKNDQRYMRILPVDEWIKKYENEEHDFLSGKEYERLVQIKNEAPYRALNEEPGTRLPKDKNGYYIFFKN